MATTREPAFQHGPVDDLEPLDAEPPFRRAALRWSQLFRPTLDVIEAGGRPALRQARRAIREGFLDARMMLTLDRDADWFGKRGRGTHAAIRRHVLSVAQEALDAQRADGTATGDAEFDAAASAYAFLEKLMGHLEAAPSMPLACAEIRLACSWCDRGMRQTAASLRVTAAAISLGANKFRRDAALQPGFGMKTNAAREKYSTARRKQTKHDNKRHGR